MNCFYCGKRKTSRSIFIKLDKDGHEICQSCMREEYWKSALEIIEHNKIVDRREGFVRRVDDLGRVYIPKELRQEMNIDYGDYVRMRFDGDKLYLKKYADADEKGGAEE